MTKTITIDFSVNAITSLGEEVYISGNLVELGVWNVNNGLKLQTSKELYPQWKNRKPLQIHPNVSIQFKIFIKNPQGYIRWERIQENRKFVPIESVLINLSQSRTQMIFQQKIMEQELITVRKNTYQIIHDLSEEVSEQSSSGNERQFWMERRARQRATLSSSKQFVSDAKLIYQAWQSQKFKSKPRKANEWLQIVPSIHYILQQEVENDKKRKIIDKNYIRVRKNPIIIFQEITKREQINKIQSFQQPDDILKIFHIEIDNENWCKEVVQSIRDKYEGQFIMYLNNNVLLTVAQEQILEYAQIIVVRTKKTLLQCLQKFHPKKNHHISMIKQNQFLVKKENYVNVLILYEPSMPTSLDQEFRQFRQKNDYFSCVQKNIVGHKSFQLPENLRMSLLLQKNILSRVRHNKFCIVLMCQKLVEIPQKIITKLIRISSCQNININIMTSDEISQIFKKLPVSDQDKVLVYNRYGEVFKPGKKPTNLYEQFHVSIKKYEEIFKKLKSIAHYWTQNKEIEIKQQSYSLQFHCSKTALGETLSEHLEHQFSKCEEINKYPFQIERYLTENKKNYVVHIRPVLSSTEFYSKIITSINFNVQLSTYFFVFDYTQGKYLIVDKIAQGIGERNSICEGFLMNNCSQRGLKEQKFIQFLSHLMNQNYSIIEQDLDRDKVENKKDKTLIRSQLID